MKKNLCIILLFLVLSIPSLLAIQISIINKTTY